MGFHKSTLPISEVGYKNGRTIYRLIADMNYYLTNDKTTPDFIVPAGFVTDLATILRFMMWLLPQRGAYDKAAILHDYLLLQFDITKKEVDRIFLKQMKFDGVAKWKRNLMYAAVRLFGGRSAPLTLNEMEKLQMTELYMPEWLKIAKKDYDKNIKEIKGAKDHPRIVEMHSHTSLKAQDDETPWCASAVNAWLVEAGFEGTNSAAAISFGEYGNKVRQSDLTLGDIVIFKRGSQSWMRHVGLYAGQSRVYKGKKQLLILGGNQSDKVCYLWYSISGITAIRRPKNVEVKDIAPTNAKPLTQSRTVKANVASVTATGTASIAAIASQIDSISEATDNITNSINRMANIGTPLLITACILAFGFSIYTIYTRWDDRRKGRN